MLFATPFILATNLAKSSHQNPYYILNVMLPCNFPCQINPRTIFSFSTKLSGYKQNTYFSFQNATCMTSGLDFNRFFIHNQTPLSPAFTINIPIWSSDLQAELHIKLWLQLSRLSSAQFSKLLQTLLSN